MLHREDPGHAGETMSLGWPGKASGSLRITRCFVMVLGNTMDSHRTFMDHLTISPRLREVHSIRDSDVIIAFVPVVSRAGLDAQAAMNKIPKDKPVVLVMLHHTFNPDAIVPDVRPYVDRKDVFVVDCLFHEDQGLLRCPRNDDAIRAVKNHLIREDHSEVKWTMLQLLVRVMMYGVMHLVVQRNVYRLCFLPVLYKGITRCFVMVLGNTMDSHKTFMDHLTISPRLREVHSINDSDDIIAFVPVVSRAGTDIQAAMNKIPKDKPVVLVMLHHTFNPDAVVPDVRSYVDRKDVFVVDCLFHEDQGLLRCPRNDDAIRAVKNHLIREDHSEVKS
ncbi:hypothetical protein QTP70_015971 [Hemibagrus guttatus]|uniref:Uncharacterized protein n=1 Tax=Hemibagrus guttatus TaxID=175788 RepID=A0AAE0PX95_9TELE|nr:hypothetical protein QTP70_015971 [Hemibagrus guttatus]